MIAFDVHDMTCGHCASTITKALKSADPGARVTIDLPRHRVMVEPTQASPQELHEAIAEAGYTPVAAPAPDTEAPSSTAGRSCCGTCR